MPGLGSEPPIDVVENSCLTLKAAQAVLLPEARASHGAVCNAD